MCFDPPKNEINCTWPVNPSAKNPIVAMCDAGSNNVRFNFRLKDGTESQFDAGGQEKHWHSFDPNDCGSVTLSYWSNDSWLRSIRIFNKSNIKVFCIGSSSNDKLLETKIESDEVIVGIKAHSFGTANFKDFRFIIGKKQ